MHIGVELWLSTHLPSGTNTLLHTYIHTHLWIFFLCSKFFQLHPQKIWGSFRMQQRLRMHTLGLNIASAELGGVDNERFDGSCQNFWLLFAIDCMNQLYQKIFYLEIQLDQKFKILMNSKSPWPRRMQTSDWESLPTRVPSADAFYSMYATHLAYPRTQRFQAALSMVDWLLAVDSLKRLC